MTHKFRIWSKIIQKYYNPYQHPVLHPNGTLWEWDGEGDSQLEEKDYDVEFSSGLTDKNGVEIYAGDIIECESPHHGNHLIEEVVFQQGMFMAAGIEYALNDLSFIKVIGNVNENLELLE